MERSSLISSIAGKGVFMHADLLELLTPGDIETPSSTFPIFGVSTMTDFRFENQIEFVGLGFKDGSVGIAHVTDSNIMLFFHRRLFNEAMTHVKHPYSLSLSRSLFCASRKLSRSVFFLKFVNPDVQPFFSCRTLSPLAACKRCENTGLIRRNGNNSKLHQRQRIPNMVHKCNISMYPRLFHFKKRGKTSTHLNMLDLTTIPKQKNEKNHSVQGKRNNEYIRHGFIR